ncbi:GNAT family N-acetyltransferase [Virgibacillus senegalensis]|uniref:GNAT family N-acetyltransferase n=1 Tax=Virgibacillus senegalensis TaxID=1499679 RepID=UPI00069EEF19|nr:GNAT family N-acetyltransferase [Virgibacillus senegalensis]
MFKIRKGRLDDFPELLEIYKELQQRRVEAKPEYFKQSQEPINRQDLSEILEDERKRLYVVEKDGAIQAFTVFKGIKQAETALYKERRVIKVEELYIKQNQKYKGIDQYLFEKIKQFATNIQATEIELELWEYDQELIDYYEERLELIPKTRTMVFSISDQGGE